MTEPDADRDERSIDLRVWAIMAAIVVIVAMLVAAR